MSFHQRTRNRDKGGSVSVEPVKSGGENVTPAPTKHPQAPGARTAANAYGQNGFQGASSCLVGETVTSPLADDLRRSQSGDGEDVLGAIIAHGTAGKPIGDGQDGVVRAKPYPTTFGHRPANSGAHSGGDPAVPSILDKGTGGKPVRRPG
jgi:hypothetical protein